MFYANQTPVINNDKDNMARIAGVNIPDNKRVEIALTYIYGIGLKTSQRILSDVKIDPNVRAKDLNNNQVNEIRNEINRITEKDNVRIE